jgi:hypothetical protein
MLSRQLFLADAPERSPERSPDALRDHALARCRGRLDEIDSLADALRAEIALAEIARAAADRRLVRLNRHAMPGMVRR